MRPLSLPALVLLLLMPLLLSCARSSPTAPDIQQAARVQDAYEEECGLSNHVLLGLYTLGISADRSRIETVPDRSGMMHLNVVRLLEVTACTNCLQLGEFLVTASDVLHVEVTLKHPFPGVDKCTGFDVRGIIITGSDYVFPTAGRRIAWGDDHIRLMAPDGYTTLYNPTEYPVDKPGPPALRYIPGRFAPGGDLTATLNPFVCWMKDTQRRMFPAGGSETRVLSLKLPPGDLEFGYAVDACWTPVDEPVTDPLSDFPLSANCREAYAIFPRQGAGLRPVAGSSAPLQVEIWDHQGVDTISAVTVEAPDLFAGDLALNISTATEEGILYTGTLTNELGATAGDYPLLVRVVDRDEDENLGQIDAWQVMTIRVTEHGYPLSELVYIPDGWFYMGSDPANDPWGAVFESPAHMHHTDAYYIGKYEVTWREFESFIASGGYYRPEWWSADGWTWRTTYGVTQPWQYELYLKGGFLPDEPAGVTYWEAEAFCIWAGGRLPTEPEWERGARGDSPVDPPYNNRLWPWGDEWDPTILQWQGNPIKVFHGWAPVGTYSPEGDSPWGLADCAGNATEYTSDWWTIPYDIYDQYASGDFTPPPPPEPGEPWRKVVRSDHQGSKQNYRCATRLWTSDIRYDLGGGGGHAVSLSTSTRGLIFRRRTGELPRIHFPIRLSLRMGPRGYAKHVVRCCGHKDGILTLLLDVSLRCVDRLRLFRYSRCPRISH